MHMDLYYFPL